MFFTLEDYKKIYEWISRNSIRDTEFNEALTPLDETDTITLIQNGVNVRISLKDLVDLLFLMGVSDFLNITDKYREKNITLDLAIELIPYTARKVGQVITFLDTNSKWKIYLFRGELTQWDLLNLWEDILDIEAHTINSILPDEEDLTKTLPDDKGNSYLSLKDKEYNLNDFSGLGRIILRKNIVEIEDPIYGKVKKNVLYQDMINKENTIYVIQYNFTLGGDITIPDNCILEFNGGSISGEHTITYNNTQIIGSEPIIRVTTYGNYTIIPKVFAETITFSIPTDFPDLQTAIDKLCVASTMQGKQIKLLIKSGHKLTKGLRIMGGNYSNFSIFAEDSTVQLASDFVGVRAEDADHPYFDSVDNCLFVGGNCVFPSIYAKFDMEESYGDGIALYNSKIYMNSGAGVINAGRYGIYLKDCSTACATGTIWDGSQSSGIRLQHGAIGYFMGAHLDDCVKTSDLNYKLGAVYVSKLSFCQIRESTISNSHYYAIQARRAFVDAEKMTIKDCFGGVLAQSASRIAAALLVVDGVYGNESFGAYEGSIISGPCHSINNSHYRSDFSVNNGGIILCAVQSTHSVDGVIPYTDVNVNSFNVFSNKGIINTYKGNPAYNVDTISEENKISGTLIQFPKSAVAYYTIPIDNLNIAADSIYYIFNILSNVALPSGLNIKKVDVYSVGHANTGFNSEKIFTRCDVVNRNEKYSIIITNLGYYVNADTVITSAKVPIKSLTIDIKVEFMV